MKQKQEVLQHRDGEGRHATGTAAVNPAKEGLSSVEESDGMEIA